MVKLPSGRIIKLVLLTISGSRLNGNQESWMMGRSKFSILRAMGKTLVGLIVRRMREEMAGEVVEAVWRSSAETALTTRAR